MERTKIHNIQICVGEGYDEEFSRFLKEHSVSLEPSGNADAAQVEGQGFAEFLAEFCDPSWLKGLSDALPAQHSPWCMVWGFADGDPYYITSFCTPEIPLGSLLQVEIEVKIKPLLRREFDSLQVVVVDSKIDNIRKVPHIWCWQLTPRKPALSFDWEREKLQ